MFENRWKTVFLINLYCFFKRFFKQNKCFASILIFTVFASISYKNVGAFQIERFRYLTTATVESRFLTFFYILLPPICNILSIMEANVPV